MESTGRAQVCWIFASEDEAIARELLGRAGVLEAQGLVQNWELIGPAFDLLFIAELTATLRRADVAVFLCSHTLLDDPSWTRAFSIITQNPHTRVLPVILSATTLPPELAAFQMLPRDGKPLMARPNREEALLEVIQGLLATIKFRPTVAPVGKGLETRSEAAVRHSINEIFQLDGPPTFTFIEPPEFARLQLELRTMGTGLIVEGPSKVGKSTAIRKAMEARA